jgi:probable rRNA maturation factor
MVIEINLQDLYFSETPSPIDVVQWQDWFKSWLNDPNLVLPEALGYEMSLRLTDDREIRELNRQYRQKNQPTDVLAFAALEAQLPSNPHLLAEEPLYLGDVIISVETAQKQARELNHSLVYELAWLAAHGCLHLLGWDHPDDISLTKMLAQQDYLLQSIGLY